MHSRRRPILARLNSLDAVKTVFSCPACPFRMFSVNVDNLYIIAFDTGTFILRTVVIHNDYLYILTLRNAIQTAIQQLRRVVMGDNE